MNLTNFKLKSVSILRAGWLTVGIGVRRGEFSVAKIDSSYRQVSPLDFT